MLGLLLAYAIVLMVLNQLALHSLAHNRRGVASALTHAWRLIRSSPWSALRATVVDFVLFVSILLASQVLAGFLGATGIFAFAAPFVVIALYGFGGVTRAGRSCSPRCAPRRGGARSAPRTTHARSCRPPSPTPRG